MKIFVKIVIVFVLALPVLIPLYWQISRAPKTIRITIPSLYLEDMQEMNLAIEKEYQRLHPEVKIVLDPIEVPVQYDNTPYGNLINGGKRSGGAASTQDLESIYFNKYKNLNAVLNMENYLNTINLRILTKRDLDLIWLPNVKDYADKGALLNISGILEDKDQFNGRDYLERALKAYRFNGKYYAVPLGVKLYVTLIHPEMAEKLKIRLDEKKLTWADVLEISGKCADKSFLIESGAMFAVIPTDSLLRLYLDTVCGDCLNAGLMRAALNNVVFKKKIEVFFKLKQNYSDILNIKSAFLEVGPGPGANPEIINGLEVRELSLQYGMLNRMEYLVYPPPSEMPGDQYLMKGDWIFGIFKYTRYPNQTRDYLKLLLSEKAQVVFYKNLYSMPVRKKVRTFARQHEMEWLSTLDANFDKHEAERMFRKMDAIYDQARMVKDSSKEDRAWSIVAENLSSYFDGTVRLDAILPKLEKKVNIFLQQD